jgi:hypothetical protein
MRAREFEERARTFAAHDHPRTDRRGAVVLDATRQRLHRGVPATVGARRRRRRGSKLSGHRDWSRKKVLFLNAQILIQLQMLSSDFPKRF